MCDHLRMSNPYQPPGSRVGQTRGGPLYSVRGIVVGTILGSLAAGVVMMYLNYRALGNFDLAAKVVRWGIGLFAVLTATASFLPANPLFNIGYIVLQGAIAFFFAANLQGSAIRFHEQQNGSMHSTLRAAGVGLLVALAFGFVLVVALTLVAALTGARIPGTTGA